MEYIFVGLMIINGALAEKKEFATGEECTEIAERLNTDRNFPGEVVCFRFTKEEDPTQTKGWVWEKKEWVPLEPGLGGTREY